MTTHEVDERVKVGHFDPCCSEGRVRVRTLRHRQRVEVNGAEEQASRDGEPRAVYERACCEGGFVLRGVGVVKDDADELEWKAKM